MSPEAFLHRKDRRPRTPPTAPLSIRARGESRTVSSRTRHRNSQQPHGRPRMLLQMPQQQRFDREPSKDKSQRNSRNDRNQADSPGLATGRDATDDATKHGDDVLGNCNEEDIAHEPSPYRGLRSILTMNSFCMVDRACCRTARERRLPERLAAICSISRPCSAPARLRSGKAFAISHFSPIRNLLAGPCIARNDTRNGGSAIDGRTTRHPGYAVSQVIRKHHEVAPIASHSTSVINPGPFRGRISTACWCSSCGCRPCRCGDWKMRSSAARRTSKAVAVERGGTSADRLRDPARHGALGEPLQVPAKRFVLACSCW